MPFTCSGFKRVHGDTPTNVTLQTRAPPPVPAVYNLNPIQIFLSCIVL